MRARSRFIPFAALLTALSGATEPLDGQERLESVRVVGSVVDHVTSDELPAVHVSLTVADTGEEPAWEGLTSSSGWFETRPLPPALYDLTVQSIGYSTATHSLRIGGPGSVEVRVELMPAAVELDPIVVTSRRQSVLEAYGFYERRRQGFGQTLTREEIEARNPHRVSDLFFGIAGARVTPGSPGRQRGQVLLRGGCVPDLVLDGMPVSGPVVIDDLVTVGELQALEVYHGASAPVRYGRYDCGTILAWTRTGEQQGEGEPFSWRRFGGLAGFVGLVWFLTQ